MPSISRKPLIYQAIYIGLLLESITIIYMVREVLGIRVYYLWEGYLGNPSNNRGVILPKEKGSSLVY